jgi:hypothetical protein
LGASGSPRRAALQRFASALERDQCGSMIIVAPVGQFDEARRRERGARWRILLVGRRRARRAGRTNCIGRSVAGGAALDERCRLAWWRTAISAATAQQSEARCKRRDASRIELHVKSIGYHRRRRCATVRAHC